MSEPHFVYMIPQHYQRKDLVPIEGRPWLAVKPPATGWVPIASGIWLALLFPSLQSGGLVALLVGVALLVSFVYVCFYKARQAVQVCPECLQGMAGSATRCPHCGFQELRP